MYSAVLQVLFVEFSFFESLFFFDESCSSFFSPVLPGVKAANQVVEAASATKTTPMKLKKVPEKLVRGQRTHAASFALFAAF